MTKQDMVHSNMNDSNLWVCECGKSNHGKFCVVCGRSRPQSHATHEQQKLEQHKTATIPQKSYTDANHGTRGAVVAPQESTRMGSRKWKYALLGAGFVGLVAFGFFVTKDMNPGHQTEPSRPVTAAQKATPKQSISEPPKAQPIPEVQEETSSAPNEPSKLQSSYTARSTSQPSSARVSLGGICIGYGKSKVYSLLGKEQSITDPTKSGHLRYQYPNLEVVITNNVVTGFVSKNAKVETELGIHEGSTLQEVVRAYGNDYSKFDYEGSTFYEYEMKAMNGRKCLQRFAIKNGRVDYVSCRVLDE